MQRKITTHLWFDTEASAAATFYTSLFESAQIKSTSTLKNTPSGTVEVVTIDLAGQEFTLLSAGPLFKFTPAVSFVVACKTVEEVDSLWKELSQGGSVMMELGSYPFSERYGWTTDRYGLSWQLMYMGDRSITQKITPTLMFVGAVSGKAEEAINFYVSVFKDGRVGDIMRYQKGEEPDQAGTIKHAGFRLFDQEFAAMDSARKHPFTFNEAISFIVHCDTQAEIDYFWEKLSADPKAEQCGWLKDKYGLSWQITPVSLGEMLKSNDQERTARVTKAFLKMKKFDIAQLRAAYEGR